MAGGGMRLARLRRALVSEDGALDLLRLRFLDPQAEAGFRAAYDRQALPLLRLALPAAALATAAFAALDPVLAGDDAGLVQVIRFTAVCPMLLGLFLLTCTARYRRHLPAVLTLAMLGLGLAFAAMAALAGPPGAVFYAAAPMALMLAACGLTGLHFARAAWLSALLLAMGLFATAVAHGPGSWPLAGHLLAGLTVLCIGLMTAYAREHAARCAHLQRRRLLDERRRWQAPLARARAASQAKSDFLAMISHELRTPLNAIIGFSEMMAQQTFGPLGDPHYVAYARDIHAGGNTLLEIINDILDLSKAEAGQLEVKEETVDLGHVVDGVANLMHERAVQKQLALSCRLTPEATLFRGDRGMLARVVMNLLSNAIKFTEPGGTVTVTMSCEAGRDGGLLLAIRDTGVGIAPGDLKRVMEPFLQADNSLARLHEGTGLGLPLSRVMVELHGGTLELDSVQGIGTTVRVRLPADRLVRHTPHAEAAAAE